MIASLAAAIFWLLTAFTIIVLLAHNVLQKDWFSIFTYILIGVYLPLLMSFFDWSDYHVADRPVIFYFIFIIFDICCIFFSILHYEPIDIINITFTKNRYIFPVEVYDIGYIAAVLLENKMVSGYFVPAIHFIDVHTERASGLWFLTTAVYVFVVLNIVEFLATKRIRYVVYAVIVFIFNIVTKSSRIDAAKCVIEILSFILFYYFSKRNTSYIGNETITKKKSKIPIVVLLTVLVYYLINQAIKLGNARMNSFGRYHTVYSDGIHYKGPEVLGEILTYYYGYFAMSFDNLAYNLKNVPIRPNFVGLNFFRGFYFGLLKFNKLFGLNGSEAYRANHIRIQGAAVTTGFWEAYYDYDVLVIIPFLICFFIAYYLRNKITRGKIRVVDLVLYFYWIPLWTLMSFDNRVCDYEVVLQVIMIYILFSKRYTISYE